MLGLQLVIDLDDHGSIRKVQTLDRGVNSLANRVKGSAATIAAGASRIQKGFSGVAHAFSRVAMMAKLAAAAMLAATIVTGAKFEQSIANVASVAGATATELRALSNTAREWGARTAYTASQAANAMYSLASAGMKAGQIIEAVGGVLLYAGAAATSLEEAAEVTAQALAMFSLSASQTNRVVNVFAAGVAASLLTAPRLKESLAEVGASAAAMGMSIESTVAALGLLHNAGMLGSIAGTRLKNVLMRLVQEGGSVKKLLADVAFNGENLGEVMQRLRDRGASVGEVFTSFGRIAAPAVLTLMREGAEGMGNMTKAVTGTQKAWEMYKIQMNTVKAQFTILKSAIEENMIAAFMAIEPALRKALQAMIDFTNKARPYIVGAAREVRRFVEENTEMIKSWAEVAAKALAAALAFWVVCKVVAVLTALFNILWGTIQIGIGIFKTIAVVSAATSKLITNGWFYVQLGAAHAARAITTSFAASNSATIAGFLAAQAVAIGLWLLIAAAVAAAVVLIIGFVIKYKEQVTAAMRKVGSFCVEVWDKIVEAAKATWGGITKAAEDTATAIKDSIRKPLMWIYDRFKWLAEKAGDLMDKMFPTWREAWEAMKEVTSDAVGWFGDAAEKTGSEVASGWQTGIDAIRGKLSGALAWLRGKFDDATDAIHDNTIGKFGDMEKAIADAMERLRQAGQGGAEAIVTKGGATPEEDAALAAKRKADQEYAAWAIAQVERLAEEERAGLLRTVAFADQETRGWLDARLALIESDAQMRIAAEGATASQIAEIEIEAARASAEARMAWEDAVIAKWMESNTTAMLALGALGAAYDTFFDTILDKEMTGKERREEIWQSMKRSFLRNAADMLKRWAVMELKNLLVVDAAKAASATRQRFTDAKLGAIKAYQAFASIPIVGPMLGMAAAAAAFAFLMAFHSGGLIPGRRNDMPIVAQGGEYMVRRSAVTPATRPALEYINATGRTPATATAGAAPVSLQFNVQGGEGDATALRAFVEDKIVPLLEDFQRRKGYRVGGRKVILT